MAVFPHRYLCIIAVLSSLSSFCAFSSRTERRLKFVERKLDVINGEISDFRYDISEILEGFQRLNSSKDCNKCHGIVIHERKGEKSGNTEENFEEFKQTMKLGFKAEKQALKNLQQELKENFREKTLQTSMEVNEINIKNTARFSQIETTVKDLEKRINLSCVSTEIEISSLKFQLSNLRANYENLLGINEELQSKIDKLENCQPGWFSYLTSCYYLSSEAVTWFQAKEWCMKGKAQLVEYNDMAEVDFVLNMTKTQKTWSDGSWEGFWVGADDIDEEGSFKWSTSHTPISARKSVNWLPGQPDNSGKKEDCMMTLINQNGKWNDDNCSHRKLMFVCEKQLFL